MRLTPWRVLVSAALIAGITTWVLLRTWGLDVAGVTQVPWAVPASLVLLAGVVLGLALNLRKRIKGDPGVRPLNPIGAARLLALGKACEYAGSVLAGVYGGLAVALIGDMGMGPDSRVFVAAFSSLTAVAVVVAGVILERTCRVKPPDDEQPLPSG